MVDGGGTLRSLDRSSPVTRYWRHWSSGFQQRYKPGGTMALNHALLRQAVIDSANMLVRTGAISMSHHGNFSVRVPNTDTILLTASSSFDNLKPENLALLDLDGKLVEGEINPTNAEIVHMHAIVYKERPETGAVVHTHSTYATSFALASRSIRCSCA